jgi:hypothetical protein
MKELALGRCYRGHFPFIGPGHYKLKVWSAGFHRYILPYN